MVGRFPSFSALAAAAVAAVSLCQAAPSTPATAGAQFTTVTPCTLTRPLQLWTPGTAPQFQLSATMNGTTYCLDAVGVAVHIFTASPCLSLSPAPPFTCLFVYVFVCVRVCECVCVPRG